MWVLAHSICLPAEVAASLPTVSSDIELLAQSRSKVIHEKFCLHGSLTEAYLHSLSGTTLPPSELTTQIHGAISSGCEKGAGNSSFVAGSRSYAKTSALQEVAQGLKVPGVDYGLSTSASLAKYDPQKSMWKTAQLSLLEDSAEYSETWPNWGSMQNGALFLRPTWWGAMVETESGLWPTPCARDYRGVFRAEVGAARRLLSKRGIPLNEAVGGLLNPEWVEWLMGWPIGWTGLKPLETGRLQEWLQQHGES